jgi:hypothetical protein
MGEPTVDTPVGDSSHPVRNITRRFFSRIEERSRLHPVECGVEDTSRCVSEDTSRGPRLYTPRQVEQHPDMTTTASPASVYK